MLGLQHIENIYYHYFYEQKQKKKESNKRYRDNMSDNQKQKLKDY